MIKNNQITISQSITKSLGVYVIDEQVESVQFCPKKIWHMYFECDYPNEMKRIFFDGLYFETKLIGGSSRGEKTDTYPRKKNNNKYVSQVRLDRQVDRMHGYMVSKGIKWGVHNTQTPLIAKYRENVWLRGEMDIFPTLIDERVSIIDIKTTTDVNNDFFSFRDDKIGYSSASCWGKKNCIAKNQPLFYHFLARNFKKLPLSHMIKFRPDKEEMLHWLYSQEYNMEECSFWFFVAGYGKPQIDGQITTLQYDMSPARVDLLECLVETSIERVRECVRTDFKAAPEEHLCRSCNMKDKCFDCAI